VTEKLGNVASRDQRETEPGGETGRIVGVGRQTAGRGDHDLSLSLSFSLAVIHASTTNKYKGAPLLFTDCRRPLSGLNGSRKVPEVEERTGFLFLLLFLQKQRIGSDEG
jgi:hypothetical protein